MSQQSRLGEWLILPLLPLLIMVLLLNWLALFFWELVSPEGLTYEEWLRGKRRF